MACCSAEVRKHGGAVDVRCQMLISPQAAAVQLPVAGGAQHPKLYLSTKHDHLVPRVLEN